MFKNFEDYKAQREVLLGEAEKFLAEGNKSDYDAKVNAVEKLDNDYEAFAKDAANLNVLREKQSNVTVSGSFNAETQEVAGDKYATKEYRNAFLKRLQGKELTVMENTLVTATDTIPTMTMDKIISIMEDTGLLSKVDLTFIPGYISIPKEDAMEDASWTAMGTASTDSKDGVATVNLAAHKLIKTVEIGADVSEMSIDAFEAWLVARLANKIEKACCKAIISGTGTNQPKGIFAEGSVTTDVVTYTKSGMTYKDLMKIISSLASGYRKGAEFIMDSALFYNEVLGMTTSNGEKIVVADAQAPESLKIFGYPVNVIDDVPTDTLAFGQLKAYKFNFAKAPEVKSDGSAGFRSGTTVWRAMALADGKLADDKAFVIAKKATA